MSYSKTKIDKAGLALAEGRYESDAERDIIENVLDEYRKSHLQPLSLTTLALQHLLESYGSPYYIAHRLKRKPQIVRKMRRLSVRLTQLQDIGGCRIIVEKNHDLNKLLSYLEGSIGAKGTLKLLKTADYRQQGRDESGYRAVHFILSVSGVRLELQLRSRIQHYWAESIERTSVVYGHHLKEQDGDPRVIVYFKKLSDVFFEIESGREPSPKQRLEIAQLREQSEHIIQLSDRKKVLGSYVNEGIIKTLIEKERASGRRLNNWIIVFDWNSGAFISWDIVDRDPDAAIRKYVEHERMFPSEAGYEVVMVGSSDVATVRDTHSHYFGIETRSAALESLDESLVSLSGRMDIDIGARQILLCLHRRHFWGKKSITLATLRNHYLQNVLTLDSSLEALVAKGLVLRDSARGPVSLNIKRKAEIEEYL